VAQYRTRRVRWRRVHGISSASPFLSLAGHKSSDAVSPGLNHDKRTVEDELTYEYSCRCLNSEADCHIDKYLTRVYLIMGSITVDVRSGVHPATNSRSDHFAARRTTLSRRSLLLRERSLDHQFDYGQKQVPSA
jgi:hypothetical protein